MPPSIKNLIALCLFCISLMSIVVALQLDRFVVSPTLNIERVKPAITDKAVNEVKTSVKKINNQKDLTAQLVTYEDGTVCIEIGLTSLECWDYENETIQDETKTFKIYD